MRKLLFILIVFIISCHKDGINIPCTNPSQDKDVAYALFKGKWNWVSLTMYSQTSQQYITKTPQTEGYTRSMIVRNNTYYEYLRNDSLIERNGYEFRQEKLFTLYPNDTLNVFVFKDFATGNFIGYVHFTICNDSLIFNFAPTSEFLRKEKWVRN